MSEAKKEFNIIKKHKDSFFINFHANSKVGDMVLQDNPRLIHHYGDYDYQRDQYHKYFKNIEIIQMWLIGDMELLAEVRWKEDK